MRSHSIHRSLVLAAIVFAAALDARGKNIAEWTVDLLRDVVKWPQPQTLVSDKIRVVILYRQEQARIDDANLSHPDFEERQERVTNGDIYTQLDGLRTPDYQFQAIIITDLLPQQVVAVEQFARDRKVVVIAVISRRPDAGGVPFAFDPVKQAAFARYRALRRCDLDFQTLPPKMPMAVLDNDPAYQDIDRCTPMDPADKLANPEVICHRNAFATIESQKREVWESAIRDLDVAMLHVFTEQEDHRQYPRGWGRDGYHPHVGLADYLSKFGNCPAARRELPFVSENRREKTAQLIDRQCKSVPPHVASTGIPPEPGGTIEQSELFAPLRPPRIWSELRSLW